MENGNCKITDEFLISDHRNIVENLISCLEPELCDSGFFICAQGTKIKIDCPGGKDYKLIKEQYTDHYGKKKDAWLMQWSVPENKAEIYIEIHTPLS